jgi:S-adenosylmethionine:tRNA ribosyltransferase-isomerase
VLVRAGEGLATQRICAETRLRIVDAILSGVHEPGTSHYDLLRAFTDEATLLRIDQELNKQDYRTHEFGDSVFIERKAQVASKGGALVRFKRLDGIRLGVSEWGH